MIQKYKVLNNQDSVKCMLFFCGIIVILAILPTEVNMAIGISIESNVSSQYESILPNESMIDTTSTTTTSATQQVKNISIIPGSSFPSNIDFYDPNTLSIFQGSTVRWINDDSAIHTVTSGKGLSDPNNGAIFDSGNLLATLVFEYQFNKSGTYDYFCALHPFMTGKIVVTSIH